MVCVARVCQPLGTEKVTATLVDRDTTTLGNLVYGQRSALAIMMDGKGLLLRVSLWKQPKDLTKSPQAFKNGGDPDSSIDLLFWVHSTPEEGLQSIYRLICDVIYAWVFSIETMRRILKPGEQKSARIYETVDHTDAAL